MLAKGYRMVVVEESLTLYMTLRRMMARGDGGKNIPVFLWADPDIPFGQSQTD